MEEAQQRLVQRMRKAPPIALPGSNLPGLSSSASPPHILNLGTHPARDAISSGKPRGLDLNDLGERSTTDIVNGYSIMHMTATPLQKPFDSLSLPVYKQYLERRQGLIWIQSDPIPFDRSSFNVSVPYHNMPLDTISDFAGALDNKLRIHEQGQSPAFYLVATGDKVQNREQIGLPAWTLEPNRHLLDTLKDHQYPHSSHIYISSQHGSFSEATLEIFGLKSAHFLHCGALRLTLIVQPRFSDILEARLAMHLNLEVKCSQFVQHRRMILPPSLLKQWNIPFSIVPQRPGDLLLIDHRAYHYSVNLGGNTVETVAFCDSEWLLAPTYKECTAPDGCVEAERSNRVLRSAGMAHTRPEATYASGRERGSKRKKRSRVNVADAAIGRRRPGLNIEGSQEPASTRLNLEKDDFVKGNRPGVIGEADIAGERIIAMSAATPTENKTDLTGPHTADTERELSNQGKDIVGSRAADSRNTMRTLIDQNSSPETLTKEIQLQITFAVHHWESFVWPTEEASDVPEVATQRDLEHYLGPFDPSKPGDQSWLNDRVIHEIMYSLAKPFPNAHVIDPVEARRVIELSANGKESLIPGLPLNFGGLVLLPYNTGNHWILIAAHFDRLTIDIYNDGERGPEVARYLIHSLNQTIGQDLKWKVARQAVCKSPLFPNTDG